MPAAQPNGALIESFDVSKLSTGSWEVSIKPADCAENLGLFNVLGKNATTVTPSNKTYVISERATLSVTLKQRTSPAVKGKFDLVYDGKRIEGMQLCALICICLFNNLFYI